MLAQPLPGSNIDDDVAVIARSLDAPAQIATPRDSLMDALSCRVSLADVPDLLARLRQERPADFVQALRQYSQPIMDSYRLHDPVSAWGHTSNTVVVTDDRVLIAVDSAPESVASTLENHLRQSTAAPLTSALDDQHALVVYPAAQPGLYGLTLIGCEYRQPGLSLLQSSHPDLRSPSTVSATTVTKIIVP